MNKIYLRVKSEIYIMAKETGRVGANTGMQGDAAWPLPWVDAKGAPLGIPVIEFANPPGSEIDQIIGLQVPQQNLARPDSGGGCFQRSCVNMYVWRRNKVRAAGSIRMMHRRRQRLFRRLLGQAIELITPT